MAGEIIVSTIQNIAVVFASLSGSAQRVAEQVLQNVQTKFPEASVELIDMLVANPEAFPQFDRIYIGASTYGEGDLNPFAEIFVASLAGREAEKMWKDVSFAIFALGDSSYINFCSSAELLEKFVSEHGGSVLQPILRIDVLTQDWDQQVVLINEWVTLIE